MKKKCSVMYVVSSLKKCGPTNQLYEIIRNLDFTKYTALLVVLSKPEKSDRYSDFEALPIQVMDLQIKRFTPEICQRRCLKSLVKKYMPDVIHTTGIRADVLTSQLDVGIPYCATIRCFFKEDYPGRYGRILGNIMSQKHMKALAKSTFAVFCSESLRLKYGPLAGTVCKVIHNGVDTQKYFPCKNQEDRNQLRTELNIDINKNVFVVFGEIVEWKNPLLIIKAFNESQYQEDSILIFGGKGNLLDECKKAAVNNIVFIGQTDLVSKYLRAADVFISASRTEGFPNSVLEAAVSGVRLILSDIPQHLEMFQKETNQVSFFETGNWFKLKKLIEEEQKALSCPVNYALSQYIKAQFSGNVMSQKYQKLYTQMRESIC